MINALRSEWIKLRTTKGNLVLAGLAIGIPLIIGTLIAVFGDFEQSLPGDAYTGPVLGSALLTTFLCGVLGVLCIGQEYRHSTIRTTFAAMPRRSTVLAAKVIVSAAMGLFIGAVTVGLTFAATKIAFASKDVESSLTNPGVNLTATIGLIVSCGLFALCGFGVGAIIRQPAGAIPVILLWPLLVEGLIGGLLSLVWDSAPKYMPFQTGLSLGFVNSNGEGPISEFARLPGGIYFSAWTVALVAVGWILVERRDA